MKILSLVIISGLLFIAASDLSAGSQDDYVAGFTAGANFADKMGLKNHEERVKKGKNEEIYKEAALDAYKKLSQ
ncbi:MAG: hypothetical protein JSR85_04330 [Proteobacteria bacterium]|nr:hypothetical protein [Pseudomonadota bacterium]